MTVLFCDVAGSTALGEELDPEALREVLDRYFTEIAETITKHGGTVQKFAGDSVLAVFGVPRLHEDDPLRAVRAAFEINQRLPLISDEVGLTIKLRTGINTGLVMTDVGKNLALGDAVNVAARLEQAARPGEILLGAQTLQLVRDAVEVEPLEQLAVKGKSESVAAYRLVNLDPLAPGVARRLDVPLVDRKRELSLLRNAWDQAVAESSVRLVTVMGAAGVGKSRLVEELLALVQDSASVLRGRCLHYGEGITFWPLIEALGSSADPDDPVLRHLSSGGAGVAQELFLEVRRLLETMALEQPLILYVEDLQWAESMLIDLLDHIVGLSRRAPILVLCTARPELLEVHPGWRDERANAISIVLEPLEPADCEELLDRVGPDLDPETRLEVIRTSDGNPLFVEEMVALARERGSLELPPTIHSLLAARIDGLPPRQRELVACGAIEGEVFHRSTVQVLAGPSDAAALDDHARELVRKGLIRPHRADIPGDKAYRFRHLLIRDAAYERLPRVRRAELHEQLAGWLERHAPNVPEGEELAGWHLERAILDRRQVRREVDDELILRAAGHLGAAARRAADRGDVAAARKLLERALDLAPTASPLHVELTAELAERLIESLDFGRAEALLNAAESEHPGELSLSLSRLQLMVYTHPEAARELYAAKAVEMQRDLTEIGDRRSLARLHMVGFWLQWVSSQATAAAEQVRLAAEHARAAGDQALGSEALGWYVLTLMFGPAPADKIESELAQLEGHHPGPYLQAFIDTGRAEVHRLKGDFSQAVALARRAMEGHKALGLSTMVAATQQTIGRIELSGGDALAARAALLNSDRVFAEAEERSFRSTTQALLSQAAHRLGDLEEALAAADRAEDLSAPWDIFNFVMTHDVRATAALSGGDEDAAERWARSAIEYAEMSDFPTLQGEARLGLARILAARGQTAEASAEASVAREKFEAKGDLAGIAAADALLQI